jgi:hypothetical protein
MKAIAKYLYAFSRNLTTFRASKLLGKCGLNNVSKLNCVVFLVNSLAIQLSGLNVKELLG